ncbi:MAG: Tex-like N-terminal domain-containing protein [Planctomycetota bacterium]|nr:Tex-like N-terminal domain-containing protein [Planctomycetota bacterium]
MTAQPILETLAKEFSTDVPSVQAVFEMLDAGLSAPFIGRFRRARTGAMSEAHVRRVQHRREELEELDRRRGTILRALERIEDLPAKALDDVRSCMERFELEDLYIPYRRPEPEVQLALDRGLGALADLIVEAVPREKRPKSAAPKEDAPAEDAAPGAAPVAVSPGADEEASADASAEAAPEESTEAAAEQADDGAGEDGMGDAPDELAHDAELPGEERPGDEAAGPAESPDEAPGAAGDAPAADTSASDEAASAGEPEAPAAEAPAAEAPAAEAPAAEAPAAEAPAAEAPAAEAPDADAQSAGTPAAQPAVTPAQRPEPVAVTPELSKLCAPFVDPDKGVHTESEALAGAVRILSDRVGRDARLRGHVRRVMRKKGVLRVRAIVDEKKAGRHKNLLKLKAPLRQLQGHKLTAIRQAQKERVINTFIELEPKEVMGRVRASLGKHTRPEFDALLDDIARKALAQRLLPVIEEDIRLEIKERCDAEALRFVQSHLRQLLLTPFFGRVPVAGLDVSAKGDLTFAFLDGDGRVLGDAKVEVGDKDEAALGADIVQLLQEHGPEAIAAGSGKAARAAVHRVRTAIRAAGGAAAVMVVNDAGATSYANGPRARVELEGLSIGARLAVSMGRRLQDPMAEFLKVDPKQLGLGPEQRLVSKANLKRVLDEAVASAVAFVGCDFDTVPRSVIEHLPGLDEESAKRLADRRDAGEIESREQIRAEGILTEAQWASVAAFLRIRRSPEPLDRTSLHPEQYQLARQLLESAGGSVEESLGRPGATKGLRRQNFEVDEFTWRDLMRELSFPGRDPRGRNRAPEFISENTDPIRLQAGRVIEGVVTNVASFGAFVDVGRKQDAMLHISEIATRYVRDARELLSIGQSVRARIVDGSSSRLALSLKGVPSPEGEGGGAGDGGRRGGGRRSRRGGRGRGRGRGRGEAAQPKGPAGRIWRRDGAAGAATSSSRRGGARGRGGPRRGGPGDRFDRGERVDLRKLNEREQMPANNPFRKLFSKDDETS